MNYEFVQMYRGKTNIWISILFLPGKTNKFKLLFQLFMIKGKPLSICIFFLDFVISNIKVKKNKHQINKNQQNCN